jgi:hypothetical protein
MIPDTFCADDLRFYLDCMTTRFSMIPELTAISIPVAMSRDPFKDSRPWYTPDLARMDPEEVYPAKSNGILQMLARTYIDDLPRVAKAWEVDVHDLPMSFEEADELGMEEETIAWPWLNNRDFLAKLEKSLRMRAYEVMPIVQKAGEIERDLVDLNSKSFIQTGFHVMDGPEQIQHQLAIDAAKAAMRVGDIDWDDLRDGGVIPMSTMWEDPGYPLFADSTESGFFCDIPGWRGEELMEIREQLGHLQYSRRHGQEPWSAEWRTKPEPLIVRAVEMLDRFVHDATVRQNQLFEYA